MLQLAPAAASKDRAEGERAHRRVTEQFEQIGDGVSLFHLANPDAGTFLRKRTEAKDCHSIGAPNCLAVGQKVGEFKLEFGAPPERRVTVRRCVAARQVP
jgi:hypothetical protein